MDKVENQVDETVNTVKEEGQNMLDEAEAKGADMVEEGEEMLDAAKDKGAEMVEEGKEAANKMQKEIKM